MSSITALRRAGRLRGGPGGFEAGWAALLEQSGTTPIGAGQTPPLWRPGSCSEQAGQLFRAGPESYIEHDQRGGDHRRGDDLPSRQPLLKAGRAYAVDEKDDCPAVDKEHDVGGQCRHFCCAMDKIAAN